LRDFEVDLDAYLQDIEFPENECEYCGKVLESPEDLFVDSLTGFVLCEDCYNG
jgi:hypothetical protein